MPKQLKLVTLATGGLAIPVLEAVLEAGHEMKLLLTHLPEEEDAENAFVGEERFGEELTAWAKKRGIEVSARQRPESDAVRREIEELGAELGLVVAYGRGLPAQLLAAPARGWIKVHFSLLPKHRGRHPIRSALWRGDNQAGVSVIQVTEEEDAGPILEQESLPIESGEVFGELAPRVAALGAELVGPAIARVARSKKPKTRAQNEKSATTTPDFGDRHDRAAWWLDASEIAQRLRALSPEPGMTTLVKGEKVRVLRGSVAEYVTSPIAKAGAFIGLRSGRITVLCGDGKAFAIDHVKRDDGEILNGAAFAVEKKLRVGDVLL